MVMRADVDYKENEEPEDEEDNDEETEGKKKKKTRKSAAMMYITASDARYFFFYKISSLNCTMNLPKLLHRDHLRELWRTEKELFGRLYPVLMSTNIKHPTDVFFLDIIPVIPPRYRPVNVIGGQMSENGQTTILRKIVTDTYVVKTALHAHKNDSMDHLPVDSQRLLNSIQGTTLLEKLQNAWQVLQQDINMIVDVGTSKDTQQMTGFRQVHTTPKAFNYLVTIHIEYCRRLWRKRKVSCACT